MFTAEQRVGVILGNTYRLERLIGAGGMGSVYEATHLRVPRRFAVKLLNPEIAMTQSVLERFQREAEIAGSLGDEHIAQVFDFNRADDGTPYMVLELLEGEDLAQRLARGPMSVPETVELMVQVTGALQKAHQAGIVHRDLKPSNLFLCRREQGLHAKVMDFGISKVLHQTGSGTRTGMVLGTPNYMAPEQAQGLLHEVDLRSDIFSLGAIVYECLTGRMAFQGATPVAAILNVCQSEPVPLTAIAPAVPAAVERVVSRALSKRREDRHGSALELRDELSRAAQGADISPHAATLRTQIAPHRSAVPSAESGVNPSWAARPASPPTTLRSSPGEVSRPISRVQPLRRGYALSAGLAVVVLGIALAVLAIKRDDRTPRAANPAIEAPPSAPPTARSDAAATSGSAAANVEADAAKADAAKADAAKADAAKADAAKADAAEADAARAEVHFVLDVSPANTKIEIDGKPVTDHELVVARGRELHIVARAPGYQTMRVTHRVDAGDARPLKLTLQKAAGPRPKKNDELVEDKW